MKKIVIIGSPGAGKSVFAHQLGILTGISLYHLDNLYWRADKTYISADELDAKLNDIFPTDSWIIDGNYNRTIEMRLTAADTVFYFDFSTEDCLKGITERVGKKRTDIPWVEDELNREFLEFVKNFRTESKPKIEALLIASNVNIVRFTDRNQVNEYIKSILPPIIRESIGLRPVSLITENHGSGDLVYSAGEDYILKVSCKEGRLAREKKVNDFLEGKVYASRSIAFLEVGGVTYYLKTCIRGEALLGDYLLDPPKLAKLLADAMRVYHSIPTEGCDLHNYDSEGDCFVHGDFCLPNILCCGSNTFGFIDTEASGLGDPWVDYAWCIWSFEYNLGTKDYTPLLLEALGIEFDEVKYKKYTTI